MDKGSAIFGQQIDSVELKALQIEDNRSKFQGGALYFINTDKLLIKDSNFERNYLI